jgi:glycosyltransferase involved in cell wall biosynthesis
MQNINSIRGIQAQTSCQDRRLLLVGPKPPPIGGSPLTVQAMLEEFVHYPSLHVTLINTSPTVDVKKEMTGFKFEKIKRSLYILPKYIHEISSCDAVLVFANDLFVLTLAPILLFLARIYGKPFFLKPVGAGLDLFINAQIKPVQKYMLWVLRATDGILTQTRLLEEDLRRMGCAKAQYLPGCRPLHAMPSLPDTHSSDFRMIFLGHITRLKGPLVLLDALGIYSKMYDEPIFCDFYGPIHDEIREEFLNGLKSLPNARYCGMAEPGTGPQLISTYDALVLPTYYDTEGHPGVLIEAMHAGVPAITTQIRTIPELIKNGVNGLLVPTQNSYALAEAILLLVINPALRREMGKANHLKGREFCVDAVVATLLHIVFPDSSFPRRPN